MVSYLFPFHLTLLKTIFQPLNHRAKVRTSDDAWYTQALDKFVPSGKRQWGFPGHSLNRYFVFL